MTVANGRGEAEDAPEARPEGPAPRPDASVSAIDPQRTTYRVGASSPGARQADAVALLADVTAALYTSARGNHETAGHEGTFVGCRRGMCRTYLAAVNRGADYVTPHGPKSAGTEAGPPADAIDTKSSAVGALTRARDALTGFLAQHAADPMTIAYPGTDRTCVCTPCNLARAALSASSGAPTRRADGVSLEMYLASGAAPSDARATNDTEA